MTLRTMYAECERLITGRVTALHLIRAELLDFFRNFKSHPLRTAFALQGDNLVVWLQQASIASGFFRFQQDLIEADKEVTDQAGYIISDENAPIMLKNLMKKHLKRFGKVREQKEILNDS